MVTSTELQTLRDRFVNGDKKVESEIQEKAEACEAESRKCHDKIVEGDLSFEEQLRMKLKQEDFKQRARQLRAILV